MLYTHLYTGLALYPRGQMKLSWEDWRKEPVISDRYEKMGISSTDVSMLNVLFSIDMLPRDSRMSPIVGRVIVLSLS